jgi:uncharacterized membrane protein YhaH (DUF805 family)
MNRRIQQLVPPIPNLPALQVHFGKVVFLEMISFVLLLVTPIVLLARRCHKPDRSKWRELNEDVPTGGDYTMKQRQFDP